MKQKQTQHKQLTNYVLLLFCLFRFVCVCSCVGAVCSFCLFCDLLMCALGVCLPYLRENKIINANKHAKQNKLETQRSKQRSNQINNQTDETKKQNRTNHSLTMCCCFLFCVCVYVWVRFARVVCCVFCVCVLWGVCFLFQGKTQTKK